MEKKFATAINCMDGRVQEPVIKWLKQKFAIDYVDTITEAGPNKLLAQALDSSKVNSIKKRVEISVKKHGSKIIAIIGHFDCAGNPVDKKTQIKQIKEGIKLIKTWGFKVDVIGAWVDSDWKLQEID
ncbi:MAG: hypothetical protein GF335_04575 [Candidatus Moranbacteria bacterium]|nr:hypothetical protein [Candidatus Moranbacteria bacterium]